MVYAIETYQRTRGVAKAASNMGGEKEGKKKREKGKKGREEQFKRDSIKCHLFKDTSFAGNEKGRFWKIKQRSERERERERERESERGKGRNQRLL